jgi:hypothetical protein
MVEKDTERMGTLREIADDVRDGSDEADKISALLYRVSDLYDPAEETTPQDIYLNMKFILQVVERGTLER